MAKHQSIKGLGREIYFKESAPEASKQTNILTDKQVKQQISLERATFYVKPEHQERLETLKIKLRSRLRERGQRRAIDKSELVRLALDLLTERDENELLERLAA
jgi:hypothetical protein